MKKNSFSLSYLPNFRPKFRWIALSLLLSQMSFATSITVTVPGDGSVASGGATAPYDLRGAINTLNVSLGTHSIAFDPAISSITLNAMLPVLNFVTPNDLTIGNSMGSPITIDGNSSTWRGFIVRQGTLTLRNMIIQNVTALGGKGGGGGMGAGAGLFVAGDPMNPTNVVLSNVQINTATVTGGAGGTTINGGGGLGIGSAATNTSNAALVTGGAGGLGGRGGTTFSNGGGGGGGINCGTNYTGLGGDVAVAGAQGGGIGGSAAGAGGGGGGAGGAMGGGGGGAAALSNQGGGGGGDGGTAGGPGGGAGGYGGGGGSGTGGTNGGAGGYFGGGGSGVVPGNGGFGGGGGAADFGGTNGGNGGFGGGGGGGVTVGGMGGVGGGNGASASSSSGGGAGFGGAIFVAQDSGTTFLINGAFSTDGNNTATAGNGAAGAFPGWAAGNDFFLMSGTNTIFDPFGDTITISGSIADDSAASFAGVQPGTQAGSAAGATVTIGAGVGGLVTYKGANTYSGLTTLNNKTLSLSQSGSLSSAGDLTINNTTGAEIFDISLITASSTQMGDLSGAAGTFVKLGSKTLILGNTGSTYAGRIQDGGLGGGTGGGITKQGTGVFIVSGPNTYSGTTTINSGTLRAGAHLTLPIDSAFVLADVSGATLDINSFIENIASLAGGGASGGNVTLGSGKLILNSSLTTTYSGVISGVGGILSKDGSGTQYLTRLNTYTGGTLINNGVLALTNTGTVSTGPVIINNAGATFDISGISAAGMDIGDLSGSTAGTFVTLGSKSLFLGTANNTTYPGVIQGTGGSIVKQGTGVFTLTGVNTYTGQTTIFDGTLALSGVGQLSGNSSLFIISPSIFDISQITPATSTGIGNLDGTAGSTVNLGTKTLTLQTVSTSTFSGVIQDGGSGGGITKIGTGTQIFGGMNTYFGPTTVTGGSLQAAVANTFSPNSAVVMGTAAGATLDLNDFNQQIPSLAGGAAGGGNVLLGSATLTLTGSVNTTYSGVISETGALHKTGSSVFTLAGVNTYSGSTTIDAGTLALSLNGSLNPSSAVVLNNTSILDASQLTTSGTIGSLSGDIGTSVNLGSKNLTLGNGSSTTFDGVIQDQPAIVAGAGGSITKNGAGTFTLTNVNTYSGGTTVNAGILALTGVGTLNSSGGVTVSGGTFDISQITASGMQIGDLSGAGGFVKLGAKTLTLGTANSTTYAGSIQDQGIVAGSPGHLIKQGTGRLNLTGTNNLDTGGAGGTVNINAGNLAINGPLTSSTVTVGSSGTLSGASTITGNVINNGTISPGNSIGTLTIVGNYTQATGSSYLVEVSPTAADLIAVSGTATIQGGTTLSIHPSSGNYPITNSYTILTSAGLTGTYSNVTNEMPLLRFGVRYDAFNVYLDVFIAQFAAASGCGGNIGQVALYLDSLSPIPGSDLAFAIDILRSFDSVTQINNGLAQLSPAPYKNFILAQEENVISVSRGISDHLNTLINTNCRREVDRKNRWEVWSDVFGDWAQMSNRSSGHCAEDEFLGYHATGGGALIGADYSFNNQCVLGITGAYSYSDVHVNESRAKGHINSYYGALYAIIHSRHIFFDLALIGGYDQFHASRKIEYGTLNRNAHTNHGGWDFDGHMDGGFIIGTTTEIRPFFAVDYLYIHENSFRENGADSLNLSVSETNNMLLRSEAGFNFSHCFRVSHGKWIPQVRLSAVHETFNLNSDSSLGSNGDSYQSHFRGESGSFTVKNQNTNRTLFSPGVGISGVFFEDTMLFSLDYFGEFSGDYSNQVVKGEFSWLF